MLCCQSAQQSSIRPDYRFDSISTGGCGHDWWPCGWDLWDRLSTVFFKVVFYAQFLNFHTLIICHLLSVTRRLYMLFCLYVLVFYGSANLDCGESKPYIKIFFPKQNYLLQQLGNKRLYLAFGRKCNALYLIWFSSHI